MGAGRRGAGLPGQSRAERAGKTPKSGPASTSRRSHCLPASHRSEASLSPVFGAVPRAGGTKHGRPPLVGAATPPHLDCWIADRRSRRASAGRLDAGPVHQPSSLGYWRGEGGWAALLASLASDLHLETTRSRCRRSEPSQGEGPQPGGASRTRSRTPAPGGARSAGRRGRDPRRRIRGDRGRTPLGARCVLCGL